MAPTVRPFAAAALIITTCAGSLLGASSARPDPTTPPRKPTVDLKGQATQPRPGQVLPGQPTTPTAPAAPAQPATPAQPSTPVAPASPTSPAMPTTPATPAQPMYVAAPQGAPSGDGMAVAAPQGAPSTDGQAVVAPAAQMRDVPPGPGTAAPHIFPNDPAAQQLEALRALVRNEPVAASIQFVRGSAEWRTDGGAWTVPGFGATSNGVLEIRTGVSSDLTLLIDNATLLTVNRLSRVIVRRIRVGDDEVGSPAPRRLVVDIQRGRISVDPGAPMPDGARRLVTVTTPDWMVIAQEPTEVTADPARTTSHRALPAAHP